MKAKKTPLEPSLHEPSDFRPRLVNSLKNGERRALSTIRYALRSRTTRSYSKAGSKGAGRIRPPKKYKQRVFIKVRVVKTPKQGTKLYAHVLYLARSGVSREGESQHFFDSDKFHSKDDINQTIKQWGKDPHHFRFIISPENGRDLDLEEYTRQLLEQMQKDLGEQLTWFATCHYNTDEPHVHVVVRGLGADGLPLHIAKDYIRHGFRELAQTLATEKLGERTEVALTQSLSKQTKAMKWTSIDALLERDMEQSIDGSIRLHKTLQSEHQITKNYAKVKLERLLFLQSYQLSEEISAGVWKLRPEARETLEQYEKLKRAQFLVTKHAKGREALCPLVLHDPTVALSEPIIGEVLGTGLYEGTVAKQYVLIAGLDGRNHLLEPSRFALREGDRLRRGQLISVFNQQQLHAADVVIERFARERGGMFDEKVFQDYVKDRVGKGSWVIPDGVSVFDYLDRFHTRIRSLHDTGIIVKQREGLYQIPETLHTLVAKLDASLGTKAHMKIQIDSYTSIERQINNLGLTWLDSVDAKLLTPTTAISPLALRVLDASQKRNSFLTARAVPPLERTPEKLYAMEVGRMKARLEKLYGAESVVTQACVQQGIVKRYKILGSGLHQVIKTNQGFIFRKLTHTEKRIAPGSLVKVIATKQGSRVEQVLSKQQQQTRNQKR